MTVLIVEDDPKLAGLLNRATHKDGHHAFVTGDGLEALDVLLTQSFDVAVMDVMLPGLDGVSVMKRAREKGCETPILLLTARDGPEEIVRSMDSGADDYLTKPFLLDVLLAHMRALGRRRHQVQPTVLTVGNIRLDRGTRAVQRGEKRLALTRKEYALLELMMRRAGQVVLREDLIEAGWSFQADIRENTLEFFIHSLRNKIDDTAETRIIQTIRGSGYLFAKPASH